MTYIIVEVINMTKREKAKTISAWNEIEEALTSLTQLNDDEILSCLDAIKMRLTVALDLLGEHFTDNEAQAHIGY